MSNRNRMSAKDLIRCLGAMSMAVSAVALGAFAGTVRADSGVWNTSPTDGNWVTDGTESNWSTGTATFPGALTGLSNSDVALFNDGSSSTTITINAAGLNVGGFIFDAAAPAYTIGGSGPSGGDSLLLSSGGSFQLGTSPTSFTSTGIAETINAPLVLEPSSATTAGSYSFSNNSSCGSNTFTIAGAISAGVTSFVQTTDATPGALLILGGANGGNNAVSGLISDGGAGTGTLGRGLGVQKAGTGTWALTNDANTFTGVLQVSAGTLNVSSVSDYGVASAIGARTAAEEAGLAGGIGILINGGTLQYTGSTAQSTNRNIRLGADTTNTIDASGTGNGTLSFTHTGPNTDLFLNTGTRTLTLTGSNTGNNLFAIQMTDQAGSATTLAKTGLGTWVDTANNTGSVNFTVSGGTLALTGNNSNNSNNSTVINNGGTLILSGANGSMTGTLTLNDGGTLQLQANGGNISAAGTSSAIGSPTGGWKFSNGIGSSGIATLQLRSDGNVTFANSSTSTSVANTSLNFDVNNIGAVAGSGPQGSVLSISSFISTFNATINVTGGNNTTLLIPTISVLGTGLTLNANSANLIVGSVSDVGSAGITVGGGFNTAITGNLTTGKITKSGTGTLTLSGTDTYTGGTTISAGTVVANVSAGANSALNIGASGTFNFLPAAPAPLSLGSGVVTLANGSTIGATLGGTTSQSAISSSAAASVAAGAAITINIFGIPGAATAAGVNNLLTAGSGLGNGTQIYTLGKIYNATNFTLSALSVSTTAIATVVTSQTELTSEFWIGGLASGNNVWALSDGAANSNFASDQTGTATPLTPGPNAVITFSADGATHQSAMVLGATMSIAGIVDNDSSPLALLPDGNSLAIGASGVLVGATAGGATLGAPVTLSAGQTWENDSSAPLASNNTLALGANTLTVAGGGNTSFNGSITGTGGLTSNSTGTVTLSAVNAYSGGTTVNSGVMAITGTLNTPGGMTVSTSTLNISGSLIGAGPLAAGSASGNAFVNFSGGFLTASTVSLAGVSGALVAVNQTSGAVSQTASSTTASFTLGNAANSFAYYNLAAGTIAATEVDIGGIGGGSGIFEVNGGALTSSGALTLSRGGSGQGGVLNVFSASVKFAGTGLQAGFNSGGGQLSVINALGGSISTTNNSPINLNVGGDPGSIGVLNLDGGTVQAASITGAGIVNFNGGTLKASLGSAAFLTVPTAYVYAGGAIIDTNAANVTITQPLLAPTGNGASLDSVTLPTLTGLMAPPLVAVTGDGTGATAIATVANGLLTGITITNMGVNYSSAPTFTLSGGGLSSAQSFSGTLAPNTSGGLTKIGAGTLTLTAAATSTFTGGITVNGGTLAVPSIPSLPASGATVTLNPGGIFALTHTTTDHTLIQMDPAYFAFNGGRISPANYDLVFTGSASLEPTISQGVAAPTVAALGLAGANVYVTSSVLTGKEFATLTNNAAFSGLVYNAAGGYFDTDLLLRYGLAGDVTGSGTINIDDYLAIDTGYAENLAALYVNGDFNHDGTINQLDYALIDTNALHQGNPLAAGEISLHTQEFGTAYVDAFNTLNTTPVPEPTSLLLLGIGAIGLMKRRPRLAG